MIFSRRVYIMTSLVMVMVGVSLISCSNDEEVVVPDEFTINSLEVVHDVNGTSPLAARIMVSMNMASAVTVRVPGLNGLLSDIIIDYLEANTNLDFIVYGLYPDHINLVELSFYRDRHRVLETRVVTITTGPAKSDLPEIIIDEPAAISNDITLYLVNYFGFNQNAIPQTPFIFDQFGNIRWYLDYVNHPSLKNLFFDNGLISMNNGNLLFGDGNSDRLYEVNFLGDIINTWSLHGYGFHHQVIEKSDGNYLVTVSDPTSSSVEDIILEINRFTGVISNLWDLTESLDKGRRAWPTSLANVDVDWFHANGLAYDDTDNTLIVSGRTQGVFKLNRDNEVLWILAPHRDWNESGNGTSLEPFLLQPIDELSTPILDESVLTGEINHPEFSWAWYQHSPILLPNGHIMVFDNGENRNYTGSGSYSRAVEYEIDNVDMTIRQIWAYGQERGSETYSRITSSVTLYDGSTVLFAPGSIDQNGQRYGKVIEIDKISGMVKFEATIIPPRDFGRITFHNVRRIDF